MSYRQDISYGPTQEIGINVSIESKKGARSFIRLISLRDKLTFVIKKDKKIESLIQVSYINSKEEIKERETNALLKASKKLKCKNLIVITWDYETEEKFDGENIKFVPLWKWLLE